MPVKVDELTPSITVIRMFGLDVWQECLGTISCLPAEDRNELLANIPREEYVERRNVTAHWARPQKTMDPWQTPQNRRLSVLFLETRKKLNLSQRAFAANLGVCAATVKNLESGLQFTCSPVVHVALHKMIMHDPRLLGLEARIDWDLAKRGKVGTPASGW